MLILIAIVWILITIAQLFGVRLTAADRIPGVDS